MADQDALFELPEAAPSASAPTEGVAASDPKLKVIDRRQTVCVPLDVDTLVSREDRVRAIWELTGKLNLDGFLAAVKSKKGSAGREHTDPRLLIAVWIYAYSRGISSAREVSRQMEYEPALRWLANLDVVNHTTLSDFRKDYDEALEKIFTEQLAVLDQAGMVDLEQVMHDGTKVQAQASGNSLRREKTLRERLKQARKVVAELGDPDDDQKQSRRDAARRRAAKEKQQTLEQALAELDEIRKNKRGAEEKEEARVSLTEPESRLMKHGNDGGIALSYNVQITTDGQQKVIVGASVNQSSSDAGVSLPEVMEQVEAKLHRKPAQGVADGGYMSHDNIIGMSESEVELIGPESDSSVRQAAARKAGGIAEEFAGERFGRSADGRGLLCPQGQLLDLVRENRKRGNLYEIYQASGSACSRCEFRGHCCPKGFENGRSVSVLKEEAAEVAAFKRKMATEEAKRIYRRRSEVAETPHAWIKEKFKIRKFRLRGLKKVRLETLWACLTYNAMQWIRLVWQPQMRRAAA
jgi:transposase